MTKLSPHHFLRRLWLSSPSPAKCQGHPGHYYFRSVHMSAIYRPVIITPPDRGQQGQSKKKDKGKGGDKQQEPLSKSQRLMIENGLIRQSSCAGSYHLLPLALRSMEKLISLIDKYMERANCQKMQMPSLTSASLWKTTGRLEQCQPELLKVEDRHSKQFVLSPTHEEAICDLLHSTPLTYRHLPLRLYQTTSKFRDERRPRFGLMRLRQFLMKDLYTFDASPEASKQTYSEITEVYEKLLSALDLNFVKALGSCGSIGGSMSHEYHLPSAVGEDAILHCNQCNGVFNSELLELEEGQESVSVRVSGGSTSASSSGVVQQLPKCINCGSTSSLSSTTSIEVAHSFLLSTKYTFPLDAVFSNVENAKVPLEMGCFGVGVSRLLAATLETLSTQDELRWPLRIAPYLVSIIPPKAGSKEDPKGTSIAMKLYDQLKTILPGEVIFDDRTKDTIGKRLVDNKRLGVPYILVFGKHVNDEKGVMVEWHDLRKGEVALKDVDSVCKLLYDVRAEVNKLD